MAWDNAVVTNSGVIMLQQVLAGGTLVIDGAAGGTGTVEPSSLMAQTTLKTQKQVFPVVGQANVSGGKKLNIAISNNDLVTGYLMQQVGIFAHVGSNPSALFAILQDGTGVNIPSSGDISDFALNFYAVIDFSNESNFSLTVETSALVNVGMLNSAIEPLQAQINLHLEDYEELKTYVEQPDYTVEATEYGDIFSLSENVVQGTAKGKVKGATHQNLVKNGNFADGTTGWGATGGTMSVSNGNLVFEASAVAEEHYALQALPIPIAGHKYYFTAKNLANVEWSITIYNFNEDGQYETVPSSTIQTSGSLSVCITPSSVNATPYFFIRLYCKTGETANFDDVQVYDLTAEGLTTLTDAQLAQKFSHYIDGMQSVQPQELLSRGKNLISFANKSSGFLTSAGVLNVDTAYETTGFQDILPSTNFILSKASAGQYITINLYDSNKVVTRQYSLTAAALSWANATTANERYFRITKKVAEDSKSQLEQGTTATTYELYQDSKAYLKHPLRSVPNGVCDEMDLQSGKLIKRCEEYVLKNSDIAQLVTTNANFDRVRITRVNLTGIFTQLGGVTPANWVVPNFNRYPNDTLVDDVRYINNYIDTFAIDNTSLVLLVAKGTYANLAAAQTALAGTKVVYQLAQEQAVEDAISNQLTVYPSGTVSNKAKKQYVLKAEDIAGILSDTNIDRVRIAKPIDGIGFNAVTLTFWSEIAGFEEKDLEYGAHDSVENIGFYSSKLIADEFNIIVAKGTYANLADAQSALAGTIITYDTKPELSTIPVTVHSEPVNLAAAVKSESDRNTQQDKLIREGQEALLTHEAKTVTGGSVHGLEIEEGTWTPGLSGAVNVTPSGRYIKIGNLVMASFDIYVTDTTGMDEYASINGLPFTAGQPGFAVSLANTGKATLTSGYTEIIGRIFANSAYIQLGERGSGVDIKQLTKEQIGSNASISGTVVYKV